MPRQCNGNCRPYGWRMMIIHARGELGSRRVDANSNTLSALRHGLGWFVVVDSQAEGSRASPTSDISLWGRWLSLHVRRVRNPISVSRGR